MIKRIKTVFKQNPVLYLRRSERCNNYNSLIYRYLNKYYSYRIVK